MTFDDEVITAVADSEKGWRTIQKFKLGSESFDFLRIKQLQKMMNLIIETQRRMNEEQRMEMTHEEKEHIRSFSYKDRPFSLMAEIYLRKNFPQVFE